VRGVVGSFQELALCFGYVVGGAVNVAVQDWSEGWRISYGGAAFVSVICTIITIFMPESPRWLVSHGKEEEAIKALHVLRYDDQVESELQFINMALKEEIARSGESGSWLDLVGSKELMNYRTFVGVMILVLMESCGIGVVSSFTPTIFGSFLSPSGAIAVNLGVSAAEFVTVIFALHWVERVGRRVLLVTGAALMGLSLALFALFTSNVFDYHSSKPVAIVLIFSFCL